MENYTRILDTQEFSQAVVKIGKRAERQLDVEKLLAIFVTTDAATRAETTETQLILGRRGTGKTHLMRVFERKRETHGDVVYYIDCNRLGSGFAGLDIPPKEVANKFYIALLNEIIDQLLGAATRMENPPSGVQDRLITQLVGLDACNILPERDKKASSTFNYRVISQNLESIIRELEIKRLFVILDEWAQIPIKAQPYFSDYLKRSILTVPSISIKILAVNYQYSFSKKEDSELVGIQTGADITDVVDLDLDFIWDENNELVEDFFKQVLYNHLGGELGWPLEIEVNEKAKKVLGLFTQVPAFTELVRAAEGNCRDFLCIFNRAYFDGYRKQRNANALSIPHIRDAAGRWYDHEKGANVNVEESARQTLEYIITEVVKGYKSRTFMVESTKADNTILWRLLNERVLHRLNTVYSHPDRPGRRYDLFTIDYGAYVRFKGTVNEPAQQIFAEIQSLKDLTKEERKYMVPLDDRRSIRRIIFDPDKLELETG